MPPSLGVWLGTFKGDTLTIRRVIKKQKYEVVFFPQVVLPEKFTVSAVSPEDAVTLAEPRLAEKYDGTEYSNIWSIWDIDRPSVKPKMK